MSADQRRYRRRRVSSRNRQRKPHGEARLRASRTVRYFVVTLSLIGSEPIRLNLLF
jgi:hypothetical protein